jgi:hypothetical protein
MTNCRSPWMTTLNASLSKKINITERVYAQLQGDVLNAANHPLFFFNPNTGFKAYNSFNTASLTNASVPAFTNPIHVRDRESAQLGTHVAGGAGEYTAVLAAATEGAASAGWGSFRRHCLELISVPERSSWPTRVVSASSPSICAMRWLRRILPLATPGLPRQRSVTGRSCTIPARSQASAITRACARLRSIQRPGCSSAANIDPLAPLHDASAGYCAHGTK